MNFNRRNNLPTYKKFLLIRIFALFLIVLHLSVISFPAYAQNGASDDKTSENYADGEITDAEFLFHDSEEKTFFLKSNFAEVSFEVLGMGIKITSLKSVSTDFEWISGHSTAELVDVYFDENNILQRFQWVYFGCYEYVSEDRLIFEFKSSDGEFSCCQEWSVSKIEHDGSALVMTHSITAPKNKPIKLPEKFSLAAMQFSSENGYYFQFLDKKICDETVTEDRVVNFSVGNKNGFDMSIPLYYFNAKSVHGIAVGMGSFSPDKSSVLNVGASNECMVSGAEAACKFIDEEDSSKYVFPSFFVAVYDGNIGTGKSFIKNWSSSGEFDENESLPLGYDNLVGAIEINTVEAVRDVFYNMQFFFSVSDARKNIFNNVKEILSACDSGDTDTLKYILRSTMFCDFDYTKIGLADGSAAKKYATEQDEIYRNKLASVILSGRQYPIFNGYSLNGWDGIEFYDSVNKKGVVLLFRNSSESDTKSTFAVQGVDSDTEYKVSSQDGTLGIERISGAELLKNGLTVSLNDKALSEIIYIEEAEVDFADVKILLFGNELSSLEIIAIAAVLVLIVGVIIAAIIINAEDEYKEKKF